MPSADDGEEGTDKLRYFMSIPRMFRVYRTKSGAKVVFIESIRHGRTAWGALSVMRKMEDKVKNKRPQRSKLNFDRPSSALRIPSRGTKANRVRVLPIGLGHPLEFVLFLSETSVYVLDARGLSTLMA